MIRHFYLLNDSSKSIHNFLREFQIIYMILIKKFQFFFGCCDRIVWPENAQEQRHIYQSLKSFIRFCAVVFFFDSVSFAQNSFRVYSTYALELDYLMCNLLYLLYVQNVHTDTHTLPLLYVDIAGSFKWAEKKKWKKVNYCVFSLP